MIGGYYFRIFIVCRVLKRLLEQKIMEVEMNANCFSRI